MKTKHIHHHLLLIASIFISTVIGQVDGHKTAIPEFDSAIRLGYESNRNYDLPAQPALADYLTAALYNNPRIAAAYARWQAEIEKIAIARGLPNPSLNFGYFLTNVETAVGPQQFKIGLMQLIPWFGKLRLAEKMQTIRADIALEELQNQINGLVYQVTAIYLDYYFLQRSIDITNQNIELVRTWEQVVRSKYTTARAGHPDLIKTQIELIKLEDDLKTLESKRQPMLEKFRASLNDGNLAGISVSDSITGKAGSINKDQVAASILNDNPFYRAAELRHNLTNSAVKQAHLDYYPDLGLGFDYIGTGEKSMNGEAVAESGKDPLVFMLSLNLPIWFGKTRHQVNTARYQQRTADEMQTAIENKLRAELEQVWFELEDARRKTDLYRQGLIPKSLESLRASEKAYIAEKMDFLNLVDSQRRYLQFLLEFEKSQVNYQKAFARLEQLAGRDL